MMVAILSSLTGDIIIVEDEGRFREIEKELAHHREIWNKLMKIMDALREEKKTLINELSWREAGSQ